MPFKDGSKPGPGRPKGSPNVINAEGRELMHSFVSKKFNEMEEKWDESEMSDYQKWQVLLKMAEFIYPKQRAVMMDVDLNTINDQTAGQILGEILQKTLIDENREVKFASPSERD